MIISSSEKGSVVNVSLHLSISNSKFMSLKETVKPSQVASWYKDFILRQRLYVYNDASEMSPNRQTCMEISSWPEGKQYLVGDIPSSLW